MWPPVSRGPPPRAATVRANAATLAKPGESAVPNAAADGLDLVRNARRKGDQQARAARQRNADHAFPAWGRALHLQAKGEGTAAVRSGRAFVALAVEQNDHRDLAPAKLALGIGLRVHVE